MTNLPCPNPACTHQFTASELKGATALKCPRCGTVFQFRQGTAAAKPVVKPGASPPSKRGQPAPAAVKPVSPRPASPPAAVPVVPLATPVAAAAPLAAAAPVAAAAPLARPTVPAQPAALPVNAAVAPGRPPMAVDTSRALVQEPVSAAEPGDLVSPMVRVRRHQKPSVLKRLMVLGVVLVFAAGTVVAFVRFREKVVPPREDNTTQAGGVDKFVGEIRNSKNADEKAFQIITPKKGWKLDSSIRAGLKAVSGMGIVALQRTESGDGDKERAAWVAAAAKDFGFRKPRDAELVKEGKERLDNLFGETLELKEKPETRELVGQRALTIEFKGTIKQVVWRGECFMLGRRGIGYWFYIAAPTLPEAREELDELQKHNRGFALADERAGWREQPPKTETFRGDKLPLTLTAPEAVWEKKDVTEVDEHGVLLLYGRYLQEKDNRKNSHVLVVALEKQDNPLKAARAYFEEEARKLNKDYQFEQSGEGTAGERKIPYVEVKVLLGPQPARYFLIAALQGKANTIGILCDSTWESRQIWRQDFLDLLKTLRLREGKAE
jgi:hypothetical protein